VYDSSAEDVAAVLTYARREWGHGAEPVTAEEVREIQSEFDARGSVWTAEQLLAAREEPAALRARAAHGMGLDLGLGVQPGPAAAILIGPSADGAMRRGDEKSLSRNTPRTREEVDALPGFVECGLGSGDLISAWEFGDVRLHLEWLSPPGGEGQNAANSGLFFQNSYELQVLGTQAIAAGGPEVPAKNEAGAIYNIKAADTNASTGPGTWQAYDIWFTAARFAEGQKISDARLTVYWNGTLIHDDVPLPHPTGSRQAAGEPGPESGEGPQIGSLHLQDHGSDAEGPVLYRNVWVEALVPQDYEAVPSADWIDLLTDVEWAQRGGKAVYTMAGNTLIGECRPNTPNTFQTTVPEFDDFELTFEFRQDTRLNSGVQIRSHVVGGFSNESGGLQGYQVEMDPSLRSYTGGIYDERRRAWLTPLVDHPEARAAYRSGEWNEVRVLAEGDLIRTWLNGVPGARLFDAMTARGHIGLQVHGVGSNEEPMRVEWRQLRLLELQPVQKK
jgi:hypothetical protein